MQSIAGFYTLVFGDVAYDDAPERLRKGVARHTIPLMILVRLAVSHGRTGKGLGRGLLRDAMVRTLEAADIAGLRAFRPTIQDGLWDIFFVSHRIAQVDLRNPVALDQHV